MDLIREYEKETQRACFRGYTRTTGQLSTRSHLDTGRKHGKQDAQRASYCTPRRERDTPFLVDPSEGAGSSESTYGYRLTGLQDVS